MSKSKYLECPLCRSNARYLIRQAFLKEKLKGRPKVISSIYVEFVNREEVDNDLRGVCRVCFEQFMKGKNLDVLGPWYIIMRQKNGDIETKEVSWKD